MTTFNFSPLFRSSVGFGSIPRLLDTAMQTAGRSDGYPPYNIEKADDNHYRISVAVAGLSEDDLEITAKEDALIIRRKWKTIAPTFIAGLPEGHLSTNSSSPIISEW